MTNKEQLQQQHRYEIKDCVTADTGNYGEYGGLNDKSIDEAASSCTTVTEKAMGEFAEWIFLNQFTMYNDIWESTKMEYYHLRISVTELLTLYMQDNK